MKIKKMILIGLFLCISGGIEGCGTMKSSENKNKSDNKVTVENKEFEVTGEEDNDNKQVMEFSDFLVERCVRETLGIDWDDELTYADVKKIKNLDICNTLDPTFDINLDYNKAAYSGYIDLTDLRYFENLEVLRIDAYVGYDTIVNVDAITNCTKLKELVIPCANTYQSDTINLVGYKYWSDIFAELPQLEKVDLGMYVDDDMKEVMLSKTSNEKIEFAKGEKDYTFNDEIAYFFYKVGELNNPGYSWYDAEASDYIQEWDYNYDSLSSSMEDNKNISREEGHMFPAIKASSESDLEQQLSKLDENIEDLIIVVGNYEFDFELLERFDKLVTLTIINNDIYEDIEREFDEELGLLSNRLRGYVGVIPKNGEVLSGLNNLQVLNLSGFVGDLSFVEECKHIRELSILNCALDDANFISELKNVRELIILTHYNLTFDGSEDFYEKYYETTVEFEKQVYKGINKLAGLKYLKDMNGINNDECDEIGYYKDINNMKSLESLWLTHAGNEYVIKDVFQSSTIKNLYIRGWWDDFDYEFNKMISLENFHLWGSVDKINFQSLIELDNIKSVCLGQVDVIDEELFKETYTVELANEIAKHKKISAFMMPMGREYVYKFNQIYDREFSKILYEAGIKESAYSYYKWHGVNVDEDLTIDEYVNGVGQ